MVPPEEFSHADPYTWKVAHSLVVLSFPSFPSLPSLPSFLPFLLSFFLLYFHVIHYIFLITALKKIKLNFSTHFPYFIPLPSLLPLQRSPFTIPCSTGLVVSVLQIKNAGLLGFAIHCGVSFQQTDRQTQCLDRETLVDTDFHNRR